MLTTEQLDAASLALCEAEAAAQAIAPITETFPGLDLEDAYAIQDALVARRVARGEQVVGAKLALTASAMQARLGLDGPVFGHLLSGGLHPAGEPIAVSALVRPIVEPEIVFVMDAALAGPGVTAADVIAATRYVCAGLEIADPRCAGASFAAVDIVADNAAAAKVVLGPVMLDPRGLDLSLVGVRLDVDGEQLATATGAAVMGHPAEAVAVLANWLGARGRALEAGWTIFSGSLTAPAPLVAGSHVSATFDHLGTVTVHGV